MGKPLKLIWEGRHSLKDIILEVNPKPFQLPMDLIEERERVWEFLSHFDPHQYNGSLFLVNIRPYNSEEFPSLHAQPISYRDFKTLQYAHRGFPPVGTDYSAEIENPSEFTRSGPDEEDFRHDIFQDYSSLCCVYLITNSERTHVLVGKRQEIGGWGDGFYASPGGMLDWSGMEVIHKKLIENKASLKFELSNNLVIDLVMSEFEEEINDELNINDIDVVGIIDARNGMFGNLVVEVNLNNCNLEIPVNTNNEFVDKQLVWEPICKIKELPDNQLFGGMRFLKYGSIL